MSIEKAIAILKINRDLAELEMLDGKGNKYKRQFVEASSVILSTLEREQYKSGGKTNGDTIRNMDNEELAYFIERQIKSKCPNGDCIGSLFCYYNANIDSGYPCSMAILEYLRAENKE